MRDVDIAERRGDSAVVYQLGSGFDLVAIVPLPVPDAMVERAARAAHVDSFMLGRDDFLSEMRRILTAALTPTRDATATEGA